MATDSFPARGTGGFTIGEWASMYQAQDGIINDYMTNSKRACSMTVDNGSNTVTISPGQVSVDGYVLDIISDEALSCPAVGSGSVAYTIAAQYDPALNVAGGGGAASALGPCRLICQAGALPTAGGQKYVQLYTATRTAGQALSAVAWLDRRSWIGPVISQPEYNLVGPWSRGTLLIQTDSFNRTDSVDLSLRTVNAAGTALEWQNVLRPPAVGFPLVATLVAAFSTTPPQYFRNGPMVNFRGAIKRSSGAALGLNAIVNLGTMPVGLRPIHSEMFSVVAGNSVGLAAIQVDPDGLFKMLSTPSNPGWVAINNVSYRAEQ